MCLFDFFASEGTEFTERKHMDETLDNKYLEFTSILLEIKGDLDVHEIASLNAELINKRGYGPFFWLINELAIKNYAINISKLFEKQNKKYELNSMFGILRYIKDQDVSPLAPSVVDAYIQNKNCIPASPEYSHVEGLQGIVGNFCKEKDASLRRYRHARDKKFAHTESTEDKIKDLPSYDEMEQLFNFCFEFIRVISSAYLQVGCHRIDNDNRFNKSMCKLLKDIGIEKVVTEFPD